MGNKISYFNDTELDNIYLGFLKRNHNVENFRLYLQRHPLKYFKNDDQVIQVLEQIHDKKQRRARYEALILIVDRIYKRDLSKFNGNRILASIHFFVPSSRKLLKARGIKVNEYDFAQEQVEIAKIRSQTLETVNDSNDSSCLICFKYRKQVLFTKCGHMTLCPHCALNHQFKRCLICRQDNTGIRLVYY